MAARSSTDGEDSSGGEGMGETAVDRLEEGGLSSGRMLEGVDRGVSTDGDGELSPAALGRSSLHTNETRGHVVCVTISFGRVIWMFEKAGVAVPRSSQGLRPMIRCAENKLVCIGTRISVHLERGPRDTQESLPCPSALCQPRCGPGSGNKQEISNTEVGLYAAAR